MFELSQETTIMYSNDKSLELTTHRILHHTNERTNQIMLEDFEGYEFKNSHIGNYKTILIVFLALTLSVVLLNLLLYYGGLIYQLHIVSFWSYLWDGALMKIFTFLSLLSFVFFIISRRYFVRITGKFGFIEFRVVNPKKESVRKFLDAVEAQSNYIRNRTPL